MYEFYINYARTLWNFDKDLFDLPIYASICWSASTSTALYLFGSCCVLPFLSLAVQPSAAKRGEDALHYIVFQLWDGSKCDKAEWGCSELVPLELHVGKCEKVCGYLSSACHELKALPVPMLRQVWDPFLVDLGGVFDVLLDFFSMLFSLCSSSVFDMGDVWNVYELVAKHVWVLHKLYQDSVEFW